MKIGIVDQSESSAGEDLTPQTASCAMALALTPAGRLVAVETPVGKRDVSTESLELGFHKAFAIDTSEGLLWLATFRQNALFPPSLNFWCRFAERYLTELCHTPESSGNLKQSLPSPQDELVHLSDAAPPMHGAEYLRPELLERLWIALDEYARKQALACPGGLTEWLKQRSPLWHRVGRVCFHLAENKRDAEFPFAFLATYSPRLIDGRRVQYQPLGRALQEYAGAKNKKMLVNLLTPIQRASEKCSWVSQMVDSGEVFHPLAWKPQDAHQFLRDVPVMEESGLLVRVPDWWTKSPARIRVGVSIGSKSHSELSASSMLDFKVDLALDGVALTLREQQALLHGTDGLIFLKGRWVEVDREKLKHALEHWKKVETEVGADGVSFLQGMRLLAGASIGSDSIGMLEGDHIAWSEVHAGKWLEEKLGELRRPEMIQSVLPGSELRATLRPYQETGVKWLWFLSRLGLGACLADDMGLGKTIQVLALLLALKKQSVGNPVPPPTLLVLPTSLLSNWKTEIERFAPSLCCCYIHPSQGRISDLKTAVNDPDAFVKNSDLVLTTYGMLIRLPWLQKIRWNLLVLDEAQAIKNPSARQTRAVKELKGAARIVLTGTPVENRLTDLWSIFDFLCPGLLGSVDAFGRFVSRLEKRDVEQYSPLRKLVSPYILRRLKTDKTIIADLPDKIELQAFCNLSRKQAALYSHSVKELERGLENKDGIARRGLILAFILRFKQICNHPAQWLGSGDYAPEESGKFQRLREIAEEIASRQEKALVFTQFREMTEPLAAFLGGVFGRPGLVFHGGTEAGKRKCVVDDFQMENGPPFLVLSLKAGGIGLNLTAATHVLHFDRWWNPAVENQATDRAFRIGQKRNVMVHKFVCQGTIEEKIDHLIREKTHLADEILKGGASGLITEMNNVELLDFVRLDANTVEEE